MKRRWYIIFPVLAVLLFLFSTSFGQEIIGASEIEEREVSLHISKNTIIKNLDLDVENIARFVREREEEEERLRLEQERLEQERLEQEKLEQERLEKERLAEEKRLIEEERKLAEERRSAEERKQQKQQQESTQNNTQSKNDSSKQEQATKTYQGISSFERDVVKYTNIERVKHGLPELTIDNKLSEVAWNKSRDMQTHGYFAHESPTYGSPFDMMRHYGVSFTAAGENIAMGFTSGKSVVDAWMNSDGHRRNILNEDFTHIGVGFLLTGNYSTQLFLRK